MRNQIPVKILHSNLWKRTTFEEVSFCLLNKIWELGTFFIHLELLLIESQKNNEQLLQTVHLP
jgi:hypothetical protein